jgi:hypothetical protein
LPRTPAQHHQCPAALAVADHEGLALGLGVAPVDGAQELDLGTRHRLDRLPRQRLGIEHHEVARVAGAQRDADLAVHLEAADARSVAGTRIDDDEGAPALVGGRVALRRHDPRERIAGRTVERATVDDHLVIEHQHRRVTRLRVLQVDVAALAQHVQRQHRPLPAVDQVGPGIGAGRGQNGRG